jgi:hypothetical protein
MHTWPLLPLLAAIVAGGCASTGRATSDAASEPLASEIGTHGRLPVGPEVTQLRVLSTKVNIRRPPLVVATSDNVAITFTTCAHEDVTLSAEPRSLEVRGSWASVRPDGETGSRPAYQHYEAARATVAGGRTLVLWTDETSNQVLAAFYDVDGAQRQPTFAVSSEAMTVLGSPQVAAVDDRHLVVAFFAADDNGIELAAASIELPQ